MDGNSQVAAQSSYTKFNMNDGLALTGDDDIVLILHCSSMTEFDEFVTTYMNDSPVSGYKTLVSMREYKVWDKR